MEEDILIRKAELDQLRRDTLVETIQLKELEEELAVITSEYDEILATKKEEEREEIRRRLEERRRERAAIKVWLSLPLPRLCNLLDKFVFVIDPTMVPLLSFPDNEVSY